VGYLPADPLLFTERPSEKTIHSVTATATGYYDHRLRGITMIKPIFVILLLITSAFLAGCTTDTKTGHDVFGRTPNYYYSHAPVRPSTMDGCGFYYENITVLDKTTEVVPQGFGSRTSYVIVADDNIQREAASFEAYRLLIPNNTYTVISRDGQGCGYTDHHVWIITEEKNDRRTI
jgi:predicted small secreted protein